MIWLQQLIYGLVSGLAACFPVSMEAHQDILRVIFGVEQKLPLLQLLLDGACILALLVGCRRDWKRLHQYRSKDGFGAKRKMTLRLLQTAVVPLLLVLVPTRWFGRQLSGLHILSLCLLLNGIILFIPQQLRSGNRDARTLSPLAAVALGLAGGLGGFSGISCLALMLCVALALGISRSNALSYTYFLYIPAMVVYLGYDVLELAGGMEAVSGTVMLRYALAAGACYLGCTLAMKAMRALCSRNKYTGCAFYSWGAAMLAMILFLMT